MRILLVFALCVAACGEKPLPSTPKASSERYRCTDQQFTDAITGALKKRRRRTYWDAPGLARSSWRTFYTDGMRSKVGNNPNLAVPGPPVRVSAVQRLRVYDSRVVRVRYLVRIAGPEGKRGFVVEVHVRQKKQNDLVKIRTADHPQWVRQRAAALRQDIADRLSDCAVSSP